MKKIKKIVDSKGVKRTYKLRKDSKMDTGRPLEMSAEKIQKLENAFSLDCTIDEACFNADISKQTYYNWIERNPTLLTRFDALRNYPVLSARKSVVKAFQENPDLALKYLEKKRKSEFGNQVGVEVSGSISIKDIIDGVLGKKEE